MGKATRWLRGLLGMKKDKENVENNSNYAEKRDRKRWSSGKSGKESERLSQIPANIPVTNWGWRRSYISKNRKEQNEHAIAVAAATAAAADAAVAAAQAAVAVVRLTSQGRGGLFNGGRERWAAIKIQSVFRGYLSRKALKALKGLVKLQALVRGYLVRKRAAATLHSMQVLVRAQATVRDHRSINTNYRFHPENRARNSTERFDKTRSEFHSKRLSKASNDPSLNAYDESPKIVEIDSYKPMSRSRRIYTCTSGYGDDHYYQETSSPLPCQIPARLSIPNRHHHQDFDYFFIREDSKLATAQSTPRFASSRPQAPVTPAKSVCGDSFFRPYTNCPSYMANTQSSKAKLRSLSAPKQRPESGLKRRLSLNEVMASRTSFSGVRMQQQPCTQVQVDFGF